VRIKLRGDAGFALPLLYEFCEFFGIQYVLGIPANRVFQRRAEPLQKKLKRRYRRTELQQRSFSSFRLQQLPKAWRSIQIETLRARLFKIGARIRQTARCIRVHLAPGKLCSVNSRSPSMPVSRFLRRQSVCLAR
jgi:hypothetical protein